jgi:hypothetical protein
VPSPGKELRLVQPLSISGDLARVKIASEPTGAQVVLNGQVLAGVVTPADVLVEAGKVQRFMLTLPRHVPAYIEPFTAARGATDIAKSAKLVPGTPVHVESNLEVKVSIGNLAHCRELTTPADCVVLPNTYTLEVVAAGVKLARQIKVGTATVTEKLELGTVEAGAGKQLQIGGQNVRRLVLEAGTRTVTVVDEAEGARQVQVRVKAGGTVIAN